MFNTAANKSNFQVGFVFNAKKAGSFNKAFDSVGKSLGSVTKGIAAVGTAVGAAFGAGASAKIIDDYSKSINNFGAQTGVLAKDMKGFEKSITNIYGQNLGDNMTQISDTMARVYQQTGLVGKELEKTTKNAIIMNDTFGMDVNESIRATAALTKQFGITSGQAYNLIAQGAQKGLNQNQDLTDIISEYAVYFKTMGFTADEMFNSLASGAKNGAYTIDYLADAMKEFGIRAKDGSKTTMEAFYALGLNGKQITKDFANGGDSAQQAFKTVTDTLFSLENNVKKNQIGVALFGTKFEDLEASAVQALTNTQGEINKTKDTMQEIGKIRYNDVGTAIEGIGRKLNAKLIIPIGKKLLPHMQKAADKVDGFSDKAIVAFDAVGKALAGDIKGVDIFAQLFGGDKAKAQEAYKAVNDVGKEIKFVYGEAKKLGGYVIDNWPTILPIVKNIGKAFIAWKIGKTAVDVGKLGIKGVKNLKDFKDQAFAAKDTVAKFATTTGPKVGKFATGVGKGLLGAGKAFVGFATSPVGLAVLAIGALVAAGILLYKNWDTVKAKAIELGEGLKKTFAPVGEFFGELWDKATGTFKGFVNGTIDGINFVTSAINKIGFTVPDWVPGIGGNTVGFNIKQIPQFANGAIVQKATTAVVGEAGPEAVLPLKGNRSAGILQRAIQPIFNGMDRMTLEKIANKIQRRVIERGGSGGNIYNFAPNINIEGNGNKDDIKNILQSEFSNFKRMLEKELPKSLDRVEANRRRASYT